MNQKQLQQGTELSQNIQHLKRLKADLLKEIQGELNGRCSPHGMEDFINAVSLQLQHEVSVKFDQQVKLLEQEFAAL